MKIYRGIAASGLVLYSLAGIGAIAEDNEQKSGRETISSMIDNAPTTYSLSNKIGRESFSLDYENYGEKIVLKIIRKSGGILSTDSLYSLKFTDYPSIEKKFGTIDDIEFSYKGKIIEKSANGDKSSRSVVINEEYDSKKQAFSSKLEEASMEVYRTLMDYISENKTKLSQEEIEKLDSFVRQYFHSFDEGFFKGFEVRKASTLREMDEGIQSAGRTLKRADVNANTPKHSMMSKVIPLLKLLPR